MDKRNLSALKILVSAFDFCPQESAGTSSFGGFLAWKMVEQLSREYDISVITHSQNREYVMEALEQGALPQVSISFVDLPRSGRLLRKTSSGQSLVHYLWQKKAYSLARWLHQENRFDATHHITPRFDWIPSLVGAYLPIPFIWGPLGGGESELTKIQMWGRKSRLWKICSEKAEAILVCSRETKELFPETFSKKIMYFPLGGIAEGEFPPLERHEQNGHTFQIFTASVYPQDKNLEHVLKAFQYFSNTHPEGRLRIMCRNGARESISEVLAELGLEEKVDLLDWMPRPRFRQALTAGDIFVYLDTGEESVSLLIDAMSTGLPVVGSETGGPGITIHEDWGRKISGGEPYQVVSEVVQSMEQLFKAKGLRGKLGRAARNGVREYYSWDRIGQKLSDLYAEHFLQEESIRHSRKGEGRFFY